MKKLFADFAAFTNQKQLQTTGVLLNTAGQEVKMPWPPQSQNVLG